MLHDNKILIAKNNEKSIYIYPKMANRHGLIAGATGTGKTVTLKVMAESFSAMGVPVFLADAKGDLSGMCMEGEEGTTASKRAEELSLKELGYSFKKYPTNFWDVYGETGLPLRTTVSEMGPLLLSRIMGLNDIQTDILTIIFKIADDNELLLIDIKDLKAMVRYVGDNAGDFANDYGNIAAVTINAIMRAIVALESEGAEKFFGEPALSIADWICTDYTGKGFIEVLDCTRLMQSPRMYSMFLLWMISELYELLPEVGDLDKPRMVFFFDEAHMLFDGAPKILLEKIEQVVKLIRSKGVGIYFITQNPRDIPEGVLAQLGNKIQHALRAYTPAEMKNVKAAAQSFRENPAFDTYKALSELGTGEALISVLGEDGIPTVVERAFVLPPESKMGAIESSVREQQVKTSLLYTRYNDFFDRDSAYECLERHISEQKRLAEEEALRQQAEKERAAEEKKNYLEEAKEKAKAEKEALKEKNKKKNAAKNAATSTAKTVTGTIGRQIGKTIGGTVGGSFGKTLGGNLGASLGRGIIGTLFGKS